MDDSAKKKATNKWAERLRGRSRMAVAVIGVGFERSVVAVWILPVAR